MEKLTIQEEEAMLYIWELGSCFVKKTLLPNIPNRRLPHNNCSIYWRNLERKQYIRAACVGNTYQYTPAYTRKRIQTYLMSGLCATTLKKIL